MRKPLRSIEDCKKIAQNYTAPGKWYRGNPKTYHYAYKRGWLAVCCEHMQRINNIPWTLKSCKKDAKKYMSRRQWWKKSGGAYNVARNNKWLDLCCAHMEVKLKPDNYWNLKTCIIDALKYKSREDWRRGNSSAFTIAHRDGFFEQCVSHMQRPSSGAKRYVYYFLDPVKNYIYAGLTMDLKIRGREHLHDKQIFKDSLNKGNLEFYDLGLFSEKNAIALEGQLIEKFKIKGYQVLNKAKAGSLGGNILKWTKENCINDARCYTTKKQWKTNSPNAPQIALRKGWMADCSEHFE